MYKCLHCQTVFDPADAVKYTEEWGSSYICPTCGNPDDLEEVEPCIRCGKYIDSDQRLCHDCKCDIKDDLRENVKTALKDFKYYEMLELEDDFDRIFADEFDKDLCAKRKARRSA